MWANSLRRPTRKAIFTTKRRKSSSKTNELGLSIDSKHNMDKKVNGASIETPFAVRILPVRPSDQEGHGNRHLGWRRAGDPRSRPSL